MKERKKNQKGFTLIETVLSILVLSIAMGGTLLLFQNATSHSVDSDYRVIAAQLANEKIESIIADKALQGYDSIIEGNYPDETLTGAFNGIQRIVTITEVDPNDLNTAQADSGYKRVRVTVTWGGGAAQVRTLNVDTLLTEFN